MVDITLSEIGLLAKMVWPNCPSSLVCGDMFGVITLINILYEEPSFIEKV